MKLFDLIEILVEDKNLQMTTPSPWFCHIFKANNNSSKFARCAYELEFLIEDNEVKVYWTERRNKLLGCDARMMTNPSLVGWINYWIEKIENQ